MSAGVEIGECGGRGGMGGGAWGEKDGSLGKRGKLEFRPRPGLAEVQLGCRGEVHEGCHGGCIAVDA